MDRSLCGGSSHPKHSCHFQEDSDDVFLTSFLDELEEIAEDLERCRNNPSDGVYDSIAELDETESSCLLEQDKENTFSKPDQNSLSSPTPIPTGSPLNVSTNLSFDDSQPIVSDASVENSAHSSVVQVENFSGAIRRVDDNLSEHFSSQIADWLTGSCEEHLSVAGPSGIQTQPLITQEGNIFLFNVRGSGFSRKDSPLMPNKRHSGKKPFACETCGRAFTLKGDLTNHRRIHTGEKPYVCGLCNRGFSQSGNLRQHLRTHTKEKPFECSECGKEFSAKGNLKRHLRIHAKKEEEPHKCEICKNKHGSQAACNHHHDRKDEGK